MSAENAQAAQEEKEFAEQFSKDMEAAMHELAEKYKGKIQDFAVVINWSPELHQKPYPKLMIETLRSPEGADPVRQALELSDLLNMSSMHIMRQVLFAALRDAQEAKTTQGPKLIVPGQ